MPCYRPLRGYYSCEVNPTGKRSIVFDSRKALDDRHLDLPCGQCIGCRLERSRQWAIRCLHEASLYEDNSFITLTYSDDHLPDGNSLDVKHFQDFMKRLRKRFGSGIRFFHCGEYGERFSRPHYHACVFGLDFKDKELYRVTQQGHRLYTSQVLEDLWGKGHCLIGDVTFESAAYVARYITKKITGDDASWYYGELVNYETGEVIPARKPEYVTMSRRPGVGKPWLEKFQSDVYPLDFVVINGKKCRPPKYYDTQLAISDPYLLDDLKEQRIERGKAHAADNTHDRLAVREFVHEVQNSFLKRSFENGS